MKKIVHLVGLFDVYIYIYIYIYIKCIYIYISMHSSEKVRFTRMESVMGKASVSSEVVNISVFKYNLDKC